VYRGGGTLEAWADTSVDWASGLGTEEDPYVISNYTQLASMAAFVNSNSSNNLKDKYIKLSSSFSNEEGELTTPIGINPDGNYRFKGTFDGNYQTVNLNISLSASGEYAGLFGCVDGGVIKNVGVKGSVSHSNGVVGGIVGSGISGTKIVNCFSSVTAIAHQVGGIAGAIYSSSSSNYNYVVNCYSSGNVSEKVGTSTAVGGIVGIENNNSCVYNCYMSGSYNGSHWAGPIIASEGSSNVLIDFCYSTQNGNKTPGFRNTKIEEDKTVGGVPLIDKLNEYVTSNGSIAGVELSSWVVGADGWPTFTGAANLPKVVTINGSDYTSIQAAINAATDSAFTLKLLTDVAINAAIEIPEGKTVTIDLDGYVINGNGGSFSVISNSGILSIVDSSPTTAHYFTYSSTSAWTLYTGSDISGAVTIGAINPETTTVVVVSGGCITGGKGTSQKGGGIYNNGSLSMTGCAIVGNNINGSNSSYGGGVYNTSNGIITMSAVVVAGNEIVSSNKYACGGGIYNLGKITLLEAIVINNVASSLSSYQAAGGGIYNEAGDLLAMASLVSYNLASGSSVCGGGLYVWVYGASPVVLSGGAIKGNTALQGGGIYYYVKNASDGLGFTMLNSVQITENEATTGAGIYDEFGIITLSGITTVKDNLITGTTTKNNIYLPSGQAVAIENLDASSDSIGITTEYVPSPTAIKFATAVNPVATLASMFFSDIDGYCSLVTTGGLMLGYDSKTPISISNVVAGNKEYDGSTSASFTCSVSGAENDVTVVSSVAFADKNVGTSKTVTITFSLTGTGASNYKLETTTTTASAEITTKALSLSNISVGNKVYDGNTNAAGVSASLNGKVSGDVVNIVSSASFADKNVGTSKTVSINFSLNGADSSNYSLETTTTNGSAEITQKALTIFGTTVGDKVYDGNTTAVVTVGSVSGTVAGDVVTVTASAKFNDAAAGTNKPVEVTYALTGADAGNYTASAVTLYANITEQQQGSSTTYYEPVRIEAWEVCKKDAKCSLTQFVDLSVNSWYHDGLHFCIDRQYVGGEDSTHFNPNGTLTRGMMVTLLYNVASKPMVMSNPTFNDVAAGSWYANSITWARNYKIVDGNGNNKFEPNKNITREMLAALLFNYAKVKGYDVTKTTSIDGFSDASKVSSWAVDALKWANASGIISGKSNGTLDPQGLATRAEAAVLIQQFMTTFEK